MSARDRWERVLTEDGSFTLRHPHHGETCHSLSGAWLEARERFARPCRLRERAQGARVLRVLDIGTGIGWNLTAAFVALEGTPARLEATTLERDPAVIEAALELFEEERGDARGAPRGIRSEVLGALRSALDQRSRAQLGELRGGAAGPIPVASRGSLRLCLGDARAEIREIPGSAGFDAVFLDPFSPSREPELWQESFLCDVAERMAAGSWLSTYSAAFRVRLALARSGLLVGSGPRVGRKREGTLASPDQAVPPLSERVARRLERTLGGSPGPRGRVFSGPARDRTQPID